MTPDNAVFAAVAYTLASVVYLSYSLILVARERSFRAKLGQLESALRP
ncbi:MAG: hypothetical protein ABJE10_19280 [bacterium]